MVIVNDLMQQHYRYARTAPIGKAFDPDFQPELTPKQMLKLGVFGGKYMTDCQNEFPADWFVNAKLCHEFHDPNLNFFEINASQSLAIWRKNGWIYPEDPRGWFQWYCRYYMGRRILHEDRRQIKRWRMMKRHVAQIKAAYTLGGLAVTANNGRRCCTGLTIAAHFSMNQLCTR